MKGFIPMAFALGLVALALMTHPMWWRAKAVAGGDAPGVRSSKGLALALVAFVLVVTAGGYALIGAPAALQLGPESSAPPKNPTTERMAVVSEMLKSQPHDADAWALLGRAYTAQGKHEQAVRALRTAIALKPDDGLVMADLAVALASVNRRNLQGESRQLAERALARDPRNAKALSLTGAAAFDRRDYALAIEQWEAVVQTQAAGSPLAVQALTALGDARRMAGQH